MYQEKVGVFSAKNAYIYKHIPCFKFQSAYIKKNIGFLVLTMHMLIKMSLILCYKVLKMTLSLPMMNPKVLLFNLTALQFNFK